jgi:GNAT superfamily N-acetyltransferase
MIEHDVRVRRLSAAEDALKSYCCMVEVPTPWRESLCLCQDWFAKNLGRYVEGYHLETSTGEVAGHLYYACTPRALVAYELPKGRFAAIYCEWVQRRWQGQGLGRLLFERFLDDMRREQVEGILVETSDREGQMYYGDFLPRGFTQVFEQGGQRLLYLPLSRPEVQVKPLKPLLKPGKKRPVEIDVLYGYLCPYEVSTHLLVRQVAREYGLQVVLREIWLTPETLGKYGVSRGIFINGRQVLFGGEPEQAVRLAVMDEL